MILLLITLLSSCFWEKSIDNSKKILIIENKTQKEWIGSWKHTEDIVVFGEQPKVKQNLPHVAKEWKENSTRLPEVLWGWVPPENTLQ